MVFAIHDDE